MFNFFKRNKPQDHQVTDGETTATPIDMEARRAEEQVEKIKGMIKHLNKICQDRMPQFQRALFDFEMKLRPLLKQIQEDSMTRRRAENLLKRTMPRLFEAVEDFDKFADKNPDAPNLDETRQRIIEALQTAGEQAQRVLKSDTNNDEQQLEDSIDILEASFAYNRK